MSHGPTDVEGAPLVLGPILRHVHGSEATVWVETREPGLVEIKTQGVAGGSAETFTVEGRHYALVIAEQLKPGERHTYEVRLDGETVWPKPGDPRPQPVITPLGRDEELRLVFGSCRVTLPNEPPYTDDPDEHPEGQGIDALRALAMRAQREPEKLPNVLLMLGDQIYADDLSPAMRDAISRRDRPEGAPDDQLVDFEEYAMAYRDAWSEPEIRWLLATVATSMIFDDHEIRAQWKISEDWLEDMRAEEHYDRQVPDGLMAYWIYQHLGNLSPAELAGEDIYAAVRAAGDGGERLRREMTDADLEPGHSRWSFHRDFGATRLLVIDSRAGRVLGERRRMIDDQEWQWIRDHAADGFEHLLIASSVPFFLTPALHHVEAWDDALTDGRWGPPGKWLGNKIRRAGVMDHWAAFHRSFSEMETLLTDIAGGKLGSPPSSIVMLSGDVHHCYLAEIEPPAGVEPGVAIWQAVCSAYRKQLEPAERRAMAFGHSPPGRAVARTLARLGRAPLPRTSWRIVERPCYDNQVGTLEAGPDRMRVKVESTRGCEWDDPRLTAVFERDLIGGGAAGE